MGRFLLRQRPPAKEKHGGQKKQGDYQGNQDSQGPDGTDGHDDHRKQHSHEAAEAKTQHDKQSVVDFPGEKFSLEFCRILIGYYSSGSITGLSTESVRRSLPLGVSTPSRVTFILSLRTCTRDTEVSSRCF